MKLLMILICLPIISTSSARADLKDTLMEAAKDKKNQDKAMELAKKGFSFFGGDKKEDVTATTASTSTATVK